MFVKTVSRPKLDEQWRKTEMTEEMSRRAPPEIVPRWTPY